MECYSTDNVEPFFFLCLIRSEWRMENNKEVMQKLEQILRQVSNEKGGNKQRVDFNEYMNNWLEGKKLELAVGTFDKYESLIRVHIIPYFKGKNLQDVTIKDLQAFLNLKVEQGYAPSTIRELKSAILHQSLHEAVGRHLIDINPAEYVKIPQVEQRHAKTLTTEEVGRLLKAAEGHYTYIGIAIMLFTGIRRGEMLALTWDNVNLEEAEIYIEKSYSPTRSKGAILKAPKTKKSVRCVPLSQTLVNLLKSFKDKAEKDVFVCHQKRQDKMINPRVFDRVLEVMCDKAGIEGISSHSFRHTAATAMFEAGVSTRTIADNLGHTTTRMLDTHYIHLRTNSLQKEAARLLEGVYGDVLSSSKAS